ncbi:MAG TPA: hypothetical protein VJ797_15605 [Burkholderiales bacterium]|nr:hypothetical protein [Burkholderiales bacterium]
MSLGGSLGMLYVIMRCNRWHTYVRWLARGGSDPRPKHVCSWWHKIITRRLVQDHDRQRNAMDACPVDIEEARETWLCINALPEHLRDTMIEEYAVSGSSEQKAAALGIKPNSFRDRREAAHVMLLALFNDAAAGVPLKTVERTRGRPPLRRCIVA